jgi:DNA-binding winged helix-turn-helix (wHTH) protein/tetratricopeptide (TPR) repeat protein
VTGSGRSDGESEISFAGFRLEADGTLFRGETPVHLPPKELAALQFLLARAGQIVTPMQLKHALWGDVHVTADSVPKCLSSLRARLEPEECIQTVYKRGYRFSAEVRPHGIAPAGALPRLAIPPFATDYGIPEHLGMAVAEETAVRLTRARHPAVSVLARDSVFTLALRGLMAQQIGETLHADLVLAGTLRALPSHFRLRAEMIRVQDGVQIWVEDLLVERSRIAGLESEMVNRLAFRLNTGAPGDRSSSPGWKTGVPVGRGPQEAVSASEGGSDRSSSPGWKTGGLSISAAAEPFVERRKHPQRREAYELFQRAHHEWQTLQRHRMQDGLQHLSRAIELDPSLIAAKVDLVHLCVTQAFYGFMSPSVAADLVRRAAESIPDLTPGAEAILPSLGWIGFHVDHNLPAALQAFSLSAHLPHDHWTTRLRVMFALSRHRFDEAIGMLRATLRQDPFSPSLHAHLAWALHLDSQAAESVECIRQTLALFPEDEAANVYGAAILAFNGDAARGIELAQDLVQRLPYFDIATAVHAYALACDGRAGEARAILERLQWLSRERFVLSSFTPAVHVALGDHDAALAELRAAADTRCPWFFQMLADPRLEPLHARPEFDQLRSILTAMEAAAALEPETEY